MTLNELKIKYENVPNELKIMKRWVCFKVEGVDNGKTTKRPYNALTGSLARVNDDLTWTTFNIALTGCCKYECDGIGFILGNGIFGIDLDNHGETDEKDFDKLVKEFVETLDSYSERSQSGKGVHIICQGKLPKGSRRKGNVEMYDEGRFFAFTGDVILKAPINLREEQVIPLWEKYVKSNVVENTISNRRETPPELKLSDAEIVDIAINSKNGADFYRLYQDGDISESDNDQSKADMSLCSMLAFWCNGDKEQMDRIFRNSALMRDKWDRYRGEKTYGQITIDKACEYTTEGYVRPITPSYNVVDKSIPTFNTALNSYDAIMNINENGEPIFKIKKIFKKYNYNDTGNAERFYDYFGEYFKYNVTDKIFMFWNGKTWIRDTCDIIRKYANKFIEILKAEEDSIYEKLIEAQKANRIDESKNIDKLLDICRKNTARVSNKAGKDAMLSELKSLYDIPVESCVFDNDDFLLNTDSGIVDLRTGKIEPFDRNKLMSKNTGTKVSFDEPKVWLKFLYSVFDNGNEDDTKALLDSLQTCLGYSLSGSTKEQVMFLLYGDGSNGKSTLTEQISHVMGDYGNNIKSNVLMQQKGGNNSSTYSIAKLQTARFVETGETEDGGRLAESEIKILTGGDTIAAQFKYGNEFSFKPHFKIWMSTNNKPIIRGTDFGVWRRLIPFEFKNLFTGAKKDKDLPEKLKAESAEILGWCIKGCLKYLEANDLLITKGQRLALEKYKAQMDIITQFITKECTVSDNSSIECKELYQRYKLWAIDNTEFTMKESKFGEELKKKGITVEKNSVTGKSWYIGIRINGTFTIRNKGINEDE